MVIEMVNSKQFEKRYNKHYQVNSFQQYVDRLIERFEQSGKNFQYLNLFERDLLILQKKATDNYEVKFIKTKAWYEFW